MSTEGSLPTFRYHPDPVATGAAVPDGRPCSVCGERTGWAYDGPVYGEEVEAVCLGCIASGRAAVALSIVDGQLATFNDVVGDGTWSDVSSEIVDEILHRTPGFLAWQQNTWLAHCDDACAYLGTAGSDELAEADGALDDVRAEALVTWAPEHVDRHIGELRRDGNATAYLFRCLSCGRHRAYSDAN